MFSVFPQHVFTFSNYSCQTILFPILHMLALLCSLLLLLFFLRPHPQQTHSKLPALLQCLRALLQHEQSLPSRDRHRGQAAAGGHWGSWQGQKDGQDRQGTGDSWSSRMENTRPATAPCLQLLRVLFQPLPGLCFCWYSCAPPCFWRKSLYQEKERSNRDRLCLCRLSQFKIPY